MKVWFCIDFRSDEPPTVARDGKGTLVINKVRTLWVCMDLPVLVPPGSTIALPVPASWIAGGGHIFCTLLNYEVTGSFVAACCRDEDSPLDDECYKELLSIGYQAAAPPELAAGYDSLEITPPKEPA